MKTIMKVKRHTSLFIFLHWLIVLESLILLFTGLNLEPNTVFAFLSRGTARSIHIVTASIFLGSITFFFYYFVISGEYLWFGIRRVLQAVDFFFDEIRHFLLRKPVAHPVIYDIQDKKYIRKIVPTEVLAWWAWAFLWLILGLTGLSILFPNHFNWILRLCHAIAPSWTDPISSTQAIHGFAAILYVMLAIIHAYAGWRFHLIKSIINGDEDIKVPTKSKVPDVKPGNSIM